MKGTRIEVTKRELLVSIIIVLVMVGLGFFISNTIHNNVTVSNEKYFKALKIDNDPELFNYAINTEVGHILSSGQVQAVNPVSDPDALIDGEYFAIRKIEEHYVQKTRTVTYTDSEGKTRTRTETYWEWDEVNREHFTVDSFTYLDREFPYDFIKFGGYDYNTTVKAKKGGFFSTKVRYKFYTIPTEFDITLFSLAKGKTITNNKVYAYNSIEEVITQKEQAASRHVIAFWIGWVLFTLVVVWGFVVMENRFLNGRRHR